MNKWITEQIPMKDKCSDSFVGNQGINERKVNVSDMQGIFFVLFMGNVSPPSLLCLISFVMSGVCVRKPFEK